MKKILAAAAFWSLSLVGGAEAQIVEEVRVGVLAHNISVGLNPGNENQEDGENVQAEIVFKRPKFLDKGWLGRPRPFIVGSVNTAGDTSFGGFGLAWNLQFFEKWAFAPSLGYIIHTGEIDFDGPTSDPAFAAFDAENVLFGSRDLFRTTVAINRDLTERTGIQLIYEHLSHGQILGTGRNQGNDSVGLRFYYRFADSRRSKRRPKLEHPYE